MSLQQISSEVPEPLYCLTLLQWPSRWEGRKRKKEERGEKGRKVLFPHFHFQILILCKFLLWSVSVGAIQEDSRKCWFRLAKLIQSNATAVLVSKLWFPVSYGPKRQLKGKTWKWMLFQMWFYKSIKLNENANLLVTGHYTCCCSVTHSCLTTWNPRDGRTPGFSVPQHLPKFAQVQVHCISDAIQPSHPLTPSSLPTLNLSQHQGLFQWVSCSHQVTKSLEPQFQHLTFQWVFRIYFL